MKFLNLLLLLFWVVFALVDPNPDPADQNQCGFMRIEIHNSAFLYFKGNGGGLNQQHRILGQKPKVPGPGLYQKAVKQRRGSLPDTGCEAAQKVAVVLEQPGNTLKDLIPR
jgi:hypothetical protein